MDPICIPPFHANYLAAVTAAGSNDLYKQYYINGGHCDAPILSEVPLKLIELFAWSDSLD